MPASAEDMGILGEVLRLVVEFISCPQIFSQLKDLLLLALRSVLVPVLMICHENGLDYSQLRIADSVVLLICSLVKQISSEELVSLVSSSECLSALRNHLFLLFSKPEKNTLPKVRTLMSLLPIVSLPSLVATVSGESIAQMIDLYVQIIGQCQESFENFTSGDAFTYQDRCHYRWTALSLRNISRTAVVVHTAYKPWVWGSHWLFREDMDWLVQMLNDDEKILMKIGLGILGNLILIVGSYEYLCVKIPQFLDVSSQLARQRAQDF